MICSNVTPSIRRFGHGFRRLARRFGSVSRIRSAVSTRGVSPCRSDRPTPRAPPPRCLGPPPPACCCGCGRARERPRRSPARNRNRGAGPAAAERPCARRPSEGSRRIRATCSPPAEAPGQGQATAGFPETGRLARPSSLAVSHETLKRFPHHFLHPFVSPDPAGCPRRPPRFPAPPVAQAPFPVPTPS